MIRDSAEPVPTFRRIRDLEAGAPCRAEGVPDLNPSADLEDVRAGKTEGVGSGVHCAGNLVHEHPPGSGEVPASQGGSRFPPGKPLLLPPPLFKRKSPHR